MYEGFANIAFIFAVIPWGVTALIPFMTGQGTNLKLVKKWQKIGITGIGFQLLCLIFYLLVNTQGSA